MLCQRGPLSIGIDGSQTGIMTINEKTFETNCKTSNINHDVLLVGYNSTHWTVKNSWGEEWGDKGFFYVPRNNSCGISKQVTALYLYEFTDMTDYLSLNIIKLIIILQDEGNNGWEGNVVGIKQSNGDVYYVGQNFQKDNSFIFNLQVDSRY